MNKATKLWVTVWGFILLLVLAIPTLLFTWFLLDAIFGYTEERWQTYFITAAEDTLQAWRNTALLLGGFLTLGYTWCLLGHFEPIYFMGLRVRYRAE